MGKPVVIFVFTTSSQWQALTGSSPGTGLCTPDLFVLSDGGGDISISGSPNPTPFTYKGVAYTTYPSAGTTITVTRKKTPDFSFCATDGTGSTSAYLLTGLALQNITNGSSKSPGTGGSSFPTIKVEQDKQSGFTTVSLQDSNAGGNNTTTNYDFWVMVQNATGDVGLIDPLITNQE